MIFSSIREGTKKGKNSWDKRIFPATFILLLLIGIGLRFHGLTIQSYWMDELHSARFAMPAQSLGDVVWLTAHYDAHPPLYHALLWSWYHVFGYSELTGRAMSAFFGVLGLLAIFLLGKTLWNRKAGLFALAVTSPLFFHVFYSQEVRSYSLLFLLTVLSWWAILSLIRKPDLSRTIVYASISTALIYTHYFGFFVLVSQSLYMLILLAWRRKPLLRTFYYCVIAGGVVIISFSPWIPYFFRNDMLRETWIQPVSIGFVKLFITRYFLTGGKVLWFAVPLVVFLTWLLPDREERSRKEEPEIFPYLLLTTWIVVTYGLPFILSIAKAPMLIPRVTIITLPAIVLLISGPAARLRMKYLIPISIITSVLMGTVLITRNHYYTYQWKENWRGAVQYVMKHDPTGAYPVVCNRPAYFRAYFWMLEKYPTVINAQLCDPRKELMYMRVAGGFWFLDAHEMKGPFPRLQQYMEQNCAVVESAHFKRASAVFYRFKPVLSPEQQTGTKAAENGRPLSRK